MADLKRLLVVNAGSSSTKCSVLDENDVLVEHLGLPAPGEPAVAQGIEVLLDRFAPAASVHRVVHGGPRFHQAVLVDASVEADIAALGDLAPLHNPPGLALLERVRKVAPDLPAIACFDTAFFAGLPETASTYALPAEWRSRFAIRRYGFHGLSHAWASRRVAELVVRRPEELRVVSAHLGAGASLAAIVNGHPLDTTMGFTPLDGLVMATRPGSVDPGVITLVLRHSRMDVDQVEDALERRSGLVALAGTPDLGEVIERVAGGDHRAELAYGVYLHRLRAGIAAMAAAMGGIDALVFTGGAGEAPGPMRSDTCSGLGFLGLHADGRTGEGSDDRLLSGDRFPAVAVVHSREDLQMAHQAREVLGW